VNGIRAARWAGGISALVFAFGWWSYRKALPAPCPGGVFLELRPPLVSPEPYQFRLELDGGQRVCTFEAAPGGKAHKSDCKMALEITSRQVGQQQSIVGVAIAGRPERLRLLVRRAGQAVYDALLTPEYSPFAVRRQDDQRFCGERAFVEPACLRGSADCAPYPAECDGPEDCSSPQLCCASAEWGREYGGRAATECSLRRDCLDRFGHVACHSDADCGEGTSCRDASLAGDFRPPLTACR
jgi:hypothetical protein